MTERVDQFTNTLRDRLNTAEARLEKVKVSIGAADTETRAYIQGKIALHWQSSMTACST